MTGSGRLWPHDSGVGLTLEILKLPPLEKVKYIRPPIHEQNFVPEVYR